MNKLQIKKEGFQHGFNTADNIILLQIGDYHWDSFETVSTENWYSIHHDIASDLAAESVSFEDNIPPDLQDIWWEAVWKGIDAALQKRWAAVKWSKQDYKYNFFGSDALFEACWRRLRKQEDLDINHSTLVWSSLEVIASNLVNDPASKFYVTGGR